MRNMRRDQHILNIKWKFGILQTRRENEITFGQSVAVRRIMSLFGAVKQKDLFGSS